METSTAQISTLSLHALFRSMDEGMVVMDGEGGIRVCNRRASEFLGLPATLTEKPFHIRDILAFQDSTRQAETDRKSTRLNSSHLGISYAVFCLKKKNTIHNS